MPERLIKTPQEARKILKKSGNLLMYPTDTIWGIGSILSNKEAIENLYKLKKRERSKPISILVADIEMAKKYTKTDDFIVSEMKKKLAG